MQKYTHPTLLLLLAFTSLCVFGCATIINGPTQDVRVFMPPGTRVTDAFQNEPIVVVNSQHRTILRLMRTRDYDLRFLYKDQEANMLLTSSFDAGWLVPDLWGGFFIDAITGCWNSFDNVYIVRFPNDTSHPTVSEPMIEAYDPDAANFFLSGRAGIVANGNFGVFAGVGAGYDVNTHISLLFMYQQGGGLSILPSSSSYYTDGYYAQYNLECRYAIPQNFYLTCGGGISHITSTDIQQDRFTFNDTTGMLAPSSTLRMASVDKWMPSVFAGIGLHGRSYFLELRHTFGLSNIAISNGEVGNFGITELTFGLNLHF
jgi:hypothetical protein